MKQVECLVPSLYIYITFKKNLGAHFFFYLFEEFTSEASLTRKSLNYKLTKPRPHGSAATGSLDVTALSIYVCKKRINPRKKLGKVFIGLNYSYLLQVTVY